ncbi:hypothetical protein AC628_12120 [Bradyrhizobium sp. NAS96.2]|nr:hypothetical protein AC628_12120 [Bradyrhizobium sp. NAS96.2]
MFSVELLRRLNNRSPSDLIQPLIQIKRCCAQPFLGRNVKFNAKLFQREMEEEAMPVIILWAVPAVIVLGGGFYLISHMQ